jgi:putative lipoic acid-binding regulatory protein
LTDDEKRTIELLEANHSFPGDYPLVVIAHNADQITAAICASVAEELGAPVDDQARESRPSSGGKYLSHRLSVRCQEAADVVRLYARLRRVDGVVTVM